ncbi:MAG: hypothetical protein IT165_17570 [Bryobacterales bacterium]|nr:hypothetical protein [Bryobacterales bacterium]
MDAIAAFFGRFAGGRAKEREQGEEEGKDTGDPAGRGRGWIRGRFIGRFGHGEIGGGDEERGRDIRGVAEAAEFQELILEER